MRSKLEPFCVAEDEAKLEPFCVAEDEANLEPFCMTALRMWRNWNRSEWLRMWRNVRLRLCGTAERLTMRCWFSFIACLKM